jgi:hypothetical protein
VPSFDRDVEPILAERCKLCHSPGQVADRISFDTYGEAFAWYKLMYAQVFACTMPPSCAERLPDPERNVLLKWFVCGAPLGPSAPGDAGDEPFDAGDDPFDAGDDPFDAGDDPFDAGDP